MLSDLDIERPPGISDELWDEMQKVPSMYAAPTDPTREVVHLTPEKAWLDSKPGVEYDSLIEALDDAEEG